MHTLQRLSTALLCTRMLPSLILAVVLLASAFSTAQAAQVNFNITVRSCPDGTTAEVVARWSSDPTAVFNVTRLPGPGERWSIDLSGSGHQVPGEVWPNGFFEAAWKDPVHPGFSNLRIDNSQRMTLETHAAVAVGDNVPPSFGFTVFGNGVSFFAGLDFNGDQVFPRIIETELAESEPECIDPIEQIEAKLDVIESKIDEFNLEEITILLMQLKARLDEAAAERAALEAKLDAAEQERAALETKLDAADQERAALETKLDRLDDEDD